MSLANGATLQVREVSGGKVLADFKGHAEYVLGAVFFPDGKKVASCDSQGNVLLWNADSGRLVKKLPKLNGWTTLAVSHDGQTVAAAEAHTPGNDTLTRKCEIHLWNARDGREIKRLAGQMALLTGLAFSTDDRQIYVAGADQRLLKWDVAGGKELGTIAPFEDAPGVKGGETHGRMAVSPDGKILACVQEQGLALAFIDPQRWEVQSTVFPPANLPLGDLAFYPDSRHVVTGWGHTVTVWDGAPDKGLASPSGHTGPVSSLAFTSGGERLVSLDLDGNLCAWEVATGKALATISAMRNGFVTASSNGRLVVCCGRLPARSGTHLRQLGDDLRQLRKEVSFAAPLVRCGAISPDRRFFVAGSTGKVSLVDMESGKEVWTYTPPGKWPSYLQALYVPGHDRQVLVSAPKEPAELLSAATGKVIRSFPYPCTAVAFTPDGEEAYGDYDDRGTIIRWRLDADQPKPFALQPGHTHRVGSLAVSADGKHLASASAEDGRVILWELPAGKKIKEWNFMELKDNPIPFAPLQVAFSPDGRLLASANSDGTVYLFRVQLDEK
jgi:WD40 repeat protein